MVAADDDQTSTPTNSTNSHPLEFQFKRQQELEDNAMSKGVERFRKRLAQAESSGKASTAGAARKLMQSALEPVTQALQVLVDEKGRGKRHMATKWISKVGAEVAAFMVVRTVLDGISKRITVRSAAMDVSDLLMDELRYRRFKEKAPKLYDYKLSKFNTSSYVHMARSLDATMHYEEIDVSDLVLDQREKLLLGIKLIDVVISSTQLVAKEVVTSPGGRGRAKTETFLVATPDTAEWLDQRNAELELLWPVYLPMVVPPLPWGPNRRGGYRFALRGKHPLVRGISKAHGVKTAQTAMSTVFSALNRIQETPWRVNQAVLNLVQEVVTRGGGMAGVPLMEDLKLPLRPPDIDTNEVARKAWRKKAHAIKEANHVRQGKAREFARVLSVASSVGQEAAIWFPCNLDFRGRIYPVVNYLHPQGDDLAKALLTFAQGKPLGPDGAGWLALHGANCLGETPDGVKLSKATLQDRADWIVNHTTEIEAVVADPFADLWWTKAEDPLQFFAFCVEWAGFAAYDREGRGHQYVSSLPCAQDGTCNGLQHFAALLSDEVGAEAVNVSPSDRPQDIYQRVAEGVLAVLEQDAAENPLAALWLKSGLVGRKLTKRPTMTFGYGSKKFGFRNQLIEHLHGLDNWVQIRTLFSEDTGEQPKSLVYPACSYMSTLIWEALAQVVVAASQGMAWMQTVARQIAKTGKCVEWAVPGTGFPVRQEYMRFTFRQVKTMLAGSVYKPAVYTDTDKPDAVKQANAMAPNVVHSLDAAALMLTVEQANALGVDHFGMVHDSYATHATDCPLLAGITRQAFFGLYANQDVINNLATQFVAQVGDVSKFPMPPSKGTLDLSGVLLSDYFFS
jgi:DNA-directed RNA polymerase